MNRETLAFQLGTTAHLSPLLMKARGLGLSVPEDLERLDSSEAVVRHIAECGNRVEPDNLFWSELLTALPNSPAKSDVLPHISRFVAMTGVTQRGMETVMQWVRPVVRSGT